MPSQKTLLTAEELLRLPDNGAGYELLDGRLIEVPPANFQHGSVANRLGHYLTSFVLANHLGEVFAQDTGFILRRSPDTVRAPDLAFLAEERLPRPLPATFADLVPDLVAEVVSPGDRTREVEEKVQEWLRAGVRLVWVVRPASQTVAAFYADGRSEEFSAESDLIAEPVLPGFRCRVTDLFR